MSFKMGCALVQPKNLYQLARLKACNIACDGGRAYYNIHCLLLQSIGVSCT